jgi:hypothetical protein
VAVYFVETSALAKRYIADQVIEVTPALANRAMLLAEQHVRYLAAGLPAITCISADTELNAAAMAEGLSIEDPNTHP